MSKQTTVFNVSFHLRAIFKILFGNSMILPAALPERLFFFGVLVSFVLRTLTLWLCLTCTVVGGRRFRTTSGHLESTSVFLMLAQQQPQPSVEERNLLSGAKQVFSVLMDAAVLTCTCLRPFCCCEARPVALGDEKC